MPGIVGVIAENIQFKNDDILNSFHKEPNVDYCIDISKFPKGIFGRHSVNKFQRDKIFKKIGKNLISTDGIILNSNHLLRQYGTKELGELILQLYTKYNWKLVDKLRGNFCGFIYSEDKKLIVFTDHLASKPIYYFYNKESNVMIFSSELKVVVEGMNKLGFTPHLDIQSAYCLLSFGFMLKDSTLVEEIKKLPPGNVLLYENSQIILKEYYKLSCKPYIEDSEEEIIKELDTKFKEAVKLEYQKDLEYGYSHIATLSGGLDSRTNVAYAKKLGFDNIICLNFSESDYLDEKIAKKICRENHFGFLFYALDNGDYLFKNINDIISSNDGLVLYSGAAHLYNSLRHISFQDYGLVHTGQIGDVTVGSYIRNKKHNIIDSKVLNRTAHSTKLLNKIKNPEDKNHFNYENDELFVFYEYCINGVFNGYRMIEQFTEFSSPFLHVDFLDYVMRIHPKYRYKQEIYLKWINKSIPKFTKYIWEKYGVSPNNSPFFIETYFKLRTPIRKINHKLNQRHSSMNPYEYWWKNNRSLQKNLNFIYKENLKFLEKYPALLDDNKYLFEKGTLREKTQVITLLNAIKMLNLP